MRRFWTIAFNKSTTASALQQSKFPHVSQGVATNAAAQLETAGPKHRTNRPLQKNGMLNPRR